MDQRSPSPGIGYLADLGSIPLAPWDSGRYTVFMTTTTIRITISTNALASNPSKFIATCLADGFKGSARHNGGKVIILTCDTADIDAVSADLDAAYQVRSYEVRS